ncbi:metalloregulator ArsR/SmtB family transcription factor [bacterium]|nr:metalloregulator ArsR/SmtB family transcription factor [bacterium]
MQNLETIFKTLGDSTRLRILELLKRPGKSACDLVLRSEKGMCACDIQNEIGLSQAAISHHMGLLRRAGLIHAEKRGRWMFYWRNEELLASLAEALAKTV